MRPTAAAAANSQWSGPKLPLLALAAHRYVRRTRPEAEMHYQFDHSRPPKPAEAATASHMEGDHSWRCHVV